MCNSDRFSPNVATLINTCPDRGVGIGRLRMCRASGGPGASSTTAFIVDVTS